MKAATIVTIKKELQHLPKEDLLQLCLRLGRFKKKIRNYSPICYSKPMTRRAI